MIGRRSVLTALGLVPITAAIPSTEDVSLETGGGPSLAHPSRELQLNAAKALERLATGIRKQEIEVTEMDVHSEMRMSQFMSHVLSLRFALLGGHES